MISDYGDVGREGLFRSPSPSLLSDNKQIARMTVSESTDHKEKEENEIEIYPSQVPVTWRASAFLPLCIVNVSNEK